MKPMSMRRLLIVISVAGAFVTVVPAVVRHETTSIDSILQGGRAESETGVIVYGAGRSAAVDEATFFAFDDVTIPFRQTWDSC